MYAVGRWRLHPGEPLSHSSEQADVTRPREAPSNAEHLRDILSSVPGAVCVIPLLWLKKAQTGPAHQPGSAARGRARALALGLLSTQGATGSLQHSCFLLARPRLPEGTEKRPRSERKTRWKETEVERKRQEVRKRKDRNGGDRPSPQSEVGAEGRRMLPPSSPQGPLVGR